MILLRRWADRRRIRQLKQSWEAFRAICELELAAHDADPEGPPDGAANGSPGSERPDEAPARRGFVPPSSAGLEGRFLRIKAETARLLPVLSEVVGRRALEQEADAAQRDMTELLNRVPSLADLSEMTPAEHQALLREWHVLYLFLAKLEGAMTGSAVHGTALRAPVDWLRRDTRERHSRLSAIAGFGLEAGIVLGFILMAAAMLDIDLNQARRFASAVMGRDRAQTAPMVAGADVAQTPTGETEVTASAAPDSSSTPVSVPAAGPPPAATPGAPPGAASSQASAAAPAAPSGGSPVPHHTEQAFAFRMPRVVQPVILRYGTVGTYILAGAFACGLALLFGLRSRT
jgi:hypothetical protein